VSDYPVTPEGSLIIVNLNKFDLRILVIMSLLQVINIDINKIK